MTAYSAVVESGSYSFDREGWHECYREHCGHAHRTLEAAKACLARHTRQYCNHGHISCSAAWYHGRIHDDAGHRVSMED